MIINDDQRKNTPRSRKFSHLLVFTGWILRYSICRQISGFWNPELDDVPLRNATQGYPEEEVMQNPN